MMERFKTLLLIFLVGLSFYLTYQLWDNKTRFDYLSPAEYEEPSKIGAISDWKKLIPPREIVFHYTGERHTKATSNMAQYNIIWEEGLQEWKYNDIKEIKYNLIPWEYLLEQQNGIEFIFYDGIPTTLLSLNVNLPSGAESGMEEMNRIWIYQDTLRARNTILFISDKTQKVYEGRVIENYDGKVLDLENIIQIGSQLPLQEVIRSYDYEPYYLPKETTYIYGWTYEISTIDADNIAKSLFLDISALREIEERDGSLIYTDGTKSLQVNPSNYSVRYYVPTFEKGFANENRQGIFQSVDFMNQHQGWTGEYHLTSWRKIGEAERVIFQEYISGYPVYGETLESSLGQIVLTYKNQQMNEYTRSTIRFQKGKPGNAYRIKTKDQVMEEIAKQRISTWSIQHIELAYQGVIVQGERLEMKLVPIYVVHFRTEREPLFLDAVDNEGGTRIELE